jgi:hypothetical protein
MLKKLERKKWKFLSATGTQHRSIMVSLQQESLQWVPIDPAGSKYRVIRASSKHT